MVIVVRILLAQYGVENEASEYVNSARKNEIQKGIVEKDFSSATEATKTVCKVFEKLDVEQTGRMQQTHIMKHIQRNLKITKLVYK